MPKKPVKRDQAKPAKKNPDEIPTFKSPAKTTAGKVIILIIVAAMVIIPLVALVATLISALSVILAGIIGWIGLIIPHITRLIFGADNKVILPMSALIGAIFLLIVDNTSKLIFSFEIPIGIVTAIIGIPIFIFVLKNAKKGF